MVSYFSEADLRSLKVRRFKVIEGPSPIWSYDIYINFFNVLNWMGYFECLAH